MSKIQVRPAAITVNGIDYRWPRRPVAVVCIDGGDPAYLRQYVKEGMIPNIARFMERGFATLAEGSMPSFTCPNNMPIITGTPASQHGISGNYYLDLETGRDDRAGTAPWRNHSQPLWCRRCADRLYHRQGQIAPLAGERPRCLARQHQFLVGVRRKVHDGRERHRERA